MTVSQVLEIGSGGMTAAIAPALGGVVLSLSDKAGPLLRMGTAPMAAADPRAAACFPCVPWFGRLGLSFDACGRRALLSPTFAPASPMALHGDGWITRWDFVSQTADRLLCCLDARRSPSGFPFAYEAEQEFQIADGRLQIILSVRNADSISMPAGLGLHPYFVRANSTRIAFQSIGVRALPGADDAERIDVLRHGFGRGALVSLPDETLDHSFMGFAGTALIADDLKAVQVTSDAPILHVYAPVGEDFFCLEPISHLPGAFPNGAVPVGAAILAPGETLSLRLLIGRPA